MLRLFLMLQALYMAAVLMGCGAYDMNTIPGDVNYCYYEESNNLWCQQQMGKDTKAFVGP